MAKSKQTPLNGFSREIHLILDDYADDVAEKVGDAVERITKDGAKKVRAASSARFPVPGSRRKNRRKSTGNYAKGWRWRVDKKGRTMQGVIYNKDLPGLPHLLEYEHANVDGGRTPAYEHIKPVEDELKKQFEMEVKKAL